MRCLLCLFIEDIVVGISHQWPVIRVKEQLLGDLDWREVEIQIQSCFTNNQGIRALLSCLNV